MFWLLDYLFLRNYGQEEKGINKYNLIKKVSKKKTEELWIQFSPCSVYDSKFLNRRYLQKEVSSIEYRIPRAVISFNPKNTKRILKNMFNDSLKEARKAIKKNIKINILGISLGVTLAVKLANKVRTSKLKLIVGGSNLPKCIEEGIATRKIFLEGTKKGYIRKDFERHLDEFSPIKNMDNLNKKMETLVVLSKHDKVIPYRHGEKLAEELSKRTSNLKIIRSNLFGHGLSVILFKNKK